MRVHDYVPLYFATHTPMQYVLTVGTPRETAHLEQRELVIFKVDPAKVFSVKGVVFSDGNCAARDSRIFENIAELSQLDWRVISTPDCYSREYKRKKAAEVLVPHRVPPDFIQSIVCFSPAVMRQLRKALKEETAMLNDIPWLPAKPRICVVDRSLYYSVPE